MIRDKEQTRIKILLVYSCGVCHTVPFSFCDMWCCAMCHGMALRTICINMKEPAEEIDRRRIV